MSERFAGTTSVLAASLASVPNCFTYSSAILSCIASIPPRPASDSPTCLRPWAVAVATATAQGLKQVGESLAGRGGIEAMQLRIAEEYVKQFGTLANEAASTLVVPANLSDIASMIALATSVVKNQKAGT